MDSEKRSSIYEHLLKMRFQTPQYLNKKLGECLMQQALNNAKADFDTKKDLLLSENQEIKSLPNIKDREARVNAHFKAEQKILREYDNELLALNHLLQALNLNSDNSDLKAHIKVMKVKGLVNLIAIIWHIPERCWI